jgi:hypothetical protein
MRTADPLLQAAQEVFAREQTEAIKRAEVWGILHFCRARGELVGYVDIAKALGMFSGGSELAGILGDIMTRCHLAGDPLLSSLVVKTTTGIPGKGYFTCARDLGYRIKDSDDDELAFWREQIKRVGISDRAAGEASLQDVLSGEPVEKEDREGAS